MQLVIIRIFVPPSYTTQSKLLCSNGEDESRKNKFRQSDAMFYFSKSVNLGLHKSETKNLNHMYFFKKPLITAPNESNIGGK